MFLSLSSITDFLIFNTVKVVSALPDMNYSIVSWTEPSAIDNKGIDGALSASHTQGEFVLLPPATPSHHVLYTAKDYYGNTANCSFTVTVVDDQPPHVVCPENMEYMTSLRQMAIPLGDVEAMCEDNSGQACVVTKPSPSAEYSIGEHVLSVHASDVSDIRKME